MVIEKDYKAIMVECKDKVVTEKSLVCISPYDIKTGEWILGLNEITSMKAVLEMDCKKVSKDRNVGEFFEKNLLERFDKRLEERKNDK